MHRLTIFALALIGCSVSSAQQSTMIIHNDVLISVDNPTQRGSYYPTVQNYPAYPTYYAADNYPIQSSAYQPTRINGYIVSGIQSTATGSAARPNESMVPNRTAPSSAPVSYVDRQIVTTRNVTPVSGIPTRQFQVPQFSMPGTVGFMAPAMGTSCQTGGS
jgi:hypothetical protein